MIGVVSVHHSEARVAPTLRSLQRLRSRLGDPPVVCVVNGPDALPATRAAAASLPPSVQVVAHDNAGWEFGAYQAGHDALQATRDFDWLLFVNDTFSTHQRFPGAYETRLVEAVARTVDFPVVVGQIEKLGRSYLLRGLRTHRWVTTNAFALNRAALTALGGRLWDPSLASAIRDTGDLRAFFAGELDPVLTEHISSWLFEEPPAMFRWYGAAPLSAANAERMANKARSILQEKRLAAVLEGASADFVDIKDVGLRRALQLRLLAKASASTAWLRPPSRSP